MAQLVVRDLEDDWIQELQQRAARHGRSADEEHREILRKALAPRPKGGMTLKELLLAMPDVGEDSDFERGWAWGRR